MESKLGKIVLETENGNPIVIISETSEQLKGLKMVKSINECRFNDRCSSLKVSIDDFVKIKYQGKKLDSPIVDYHGYVRISNLQVREIGVFTKEGYCKLLRGYNNHHACLGGTDPSYLSVRDDLHEQLMGMLIK